MGECLGCGAPLTRRHQKVYCSNRCQRALERRQHLERWLATGVASVATSQGHYIRLHLLAEQGDRCAICRQPQTWQGLPLVLVLDHIDGDSTHNHRDNLRMVCPNCDSQLPTYKMRNKGRGRFARRQRYADGQSY